MERSIDIKSGKCKNPIEILNGIDDGSLEWPVLDVKYKKIIGLENTVLCQYIGDYELIASVDVLSPIKLLEKNNYKYFIFEFNNIVITDHFLGIPQILYCIKQGKTKNLKYLIICNIGCELFFKSTGLFELLGEEVFVKDLKEAINVIRSYDSLSA